MAELPDRWIVDNDPSPRYRIYTRGNVGEVFPDPVTPLSWTLAGAPYAEQGWRDALERFGAFDRDEFADDNLEILGVFGGYCYLNVSVSRIFGVRAPGLTPEQIDYSLYGEQAGIPSYAEEARPEDESPEHSAKVGETLQWVLTADALPELLDEQQKMEALRASRPDPAAMTDRELVDRVRALMAEHFRRQFAQHLYVTYGSTVPAGIIQAVCTEIGDPTLAMRLVSGLGGVDSAEPSWALWDLGRMVAASRSLTNAFDGGVQGVLAALRGSDDPDAEKFLTRFDEFLYRFGSRGQNEWEMACQSWETKPALALAAVDRMRLAPEHESPGAHREAIAAERRQLSETIVSQLAADPEVQGQFQAALHSASIFFPGRERTKTNVIRLVNECRICMHELGRRMVEAGHFDELGDFSMIKNDEYDEFLQDPGAFTSEIRRRRAWYQELEKLEPPFIVIGQPPPPSTWHRRAERTVDSARPGDTLAGIPGCPGKASGRARVILDPSDPTALEPGDVLVAPITDPAWTPLFVPAAAVVVDVGAQLSHAIIVSRELGIPCVVSVTDGTRRIPDGATITVDGTMGTVTVN